MGEGLFPVSTRPVSAARLRLLTRKELNVKTPLKFIAAAILSLVVTACGHEPVGKNFEFDETKDYGLLAYDIYFIGETWPNFSIYLFPYDEETGTIDAKHRVDTGCGFVCEIGNEEVRFYLKPVDPGTYVIGYMFFQGQHKKTILCYPEQTIEVTIEPGTVHYIGEMTIPMDYKDGVTMEKLELIPHDEEHVRGRLLNFPHVRDVDPIYRPDGTVRAVRNTAKPGRIVIDPLKYVTFERGEVKRENACILDYTS